MVDAMAMTMLCIYLVRCAANPQPIFQGTPLRYQIAELPSTVAFGNPSPNPSPDPNPNPNLNQTLTKP